MSSQASRNVFSEDVPASFHCAVARKKNLRLLSEELLLTQKREVKTCVFVIFFARNSGKKNGVQVTVSAPRFYQRELKSLLCKYK